MLKNQDIICISSIDWDFVWQGHQEIMSTFARNGNRVLFIENTGVRTPRLGDIPRLKKRIMNWFKSTRGFNKKDDNLYIYSPVILPFPYSRIARWINKKIMARTLKLWMKVTDFHDPIIWTFLPTGTALDIIASLDHKLLVYYCIADFYELSSRPKMIMDTENKLLKKCDIVFAQGEMLKERCEKFNKNVHIFPFGVSVEMFDNFMRSKSSQPAPEDIRQIKEPIIGYVGGIHKHIDFALIKYIAESHPQWNIVMVGPDQAHTNELDNIPNIIMLGKKDFSSLPAYINKFDVCIIPYELNGYTMTVFPTKLNEYHAMGKPVVSTELPEVVRFNELNDNLVSICKDRDEFVKGIAKMLAAKDDKSLQAKRKVAAGANKWSARIDQMSLLMEDEIARKSSQDTDWKERFLNFYKFSRKKLLKAGIAAFVIYVLMIHTPLLWLIAEPLKIEQAPEKADAIVVFAGGVGESGKAGQGYEERVSYAAKLYKEGLAGHVIFSSGYTYVFKEPFVMKALALSLGVPENAIILETKATNTYENVRFTSNIVTGFGWKKVIVISSPYNMRRVSLVYKKAVPNIKFICAPVPYSLFYGNGKKVEFKQISSIAHEYAALIYYKLFGLI